MCLGSIGQGMGKSLKVIDTQPWLQPGCPVSALSQWIDSTSTHILSATRVALMCLPCCDRLKSPQTMSKRNRCSLWVFCHRNTKLIQIKTNIHVQSLPHDKRMVHQPSTLWESCRVTVASPPSSKLHSQDLRNGLWRDDFRDVTSQVWGLNFIKPPIKWKMDLKYMCGVRFCMHMCVCVCTYMYTHMPGFPTEGQRSILWILFSLPSHELWELKSGIQSCMPSTLPTKPSHLP